VGSLGFRLAAVELHAADGIGHVSHYRYSF
jgi:hypothetical protein